MSLPSILYSLASVPMFASRPFLAAFVTALLARFGTHIPWLASSSVVQALAHAPAWFTSWPCLFILAALAAAEVLAVKHSEVRAFLAEFDGWIKSAVAMLVCLAIVDKDTARTIESIHKSGIGVSSLLSIGIGVLTYFSASLRHAVFSHVANIDDHDDIGLQSALNWAENSWTVLGLLFLVVFPIVALILSALTALGLWLVERSAERAEQRSKIPCTKCGTPTLPHAIACPACRTKLAAPLAVGVFGQPKAEPATDLVLHAFNLVSRKRCPVCATRLKQRAVQQSCPECKTVTFASRAEFERYLAAITKRLPKTLFICFLLGAIPVIGVVPGVLYYRLAIVSGLRGYIPPLRGCLTKVLVRIINWGIILLQPIPILGALIIPLMCWSSYMIYRRALVGRAEHDLAPANIAA